MARTYEGITGRIVGVGLGTALFAVGAGVYALVGPPNDAMPRVLERPLLRQFPQLATAGNELSSVVLVVTLLLCALFAVGGLATVLKALVLPGYSITLGEE